MRTLVAVAVLLLASTAHADPIPAGCGKDTGAAVKAHLHEARVLADASDADYKAANDCDDQIAALQELIAEERKNPAGVIDLRRLHELGADIQVQQAAKAAALAEAKGLTAKAAELLAEAKAAMARCRR